MSDNKLMNGEIRVVENIGPYSEDAFGHEGDALMVIDGEIEDNEGFPWRGNCDGFKSIEHVNEYFATADEYQTVFELVED